MKTPRSFRVPSLITQCAAPLALAALLATNSAQAVTYEYFGTTSNTAGTAYQWTDGTNWAAPGVPVSATDAGVWFSNATLAAGATIFSNNNNAGVFQLFNLNFNYAGPVSGVAPQVTLSGNAIEVGEKVNFFNNGGVLPEYTISNNLQTTAGGTFGIIVADPLSATISGNLTGKNVYKAGEGDLTLTGGASSLTGDLTNVGGGTLNLAGTMNVAGALITKGFGGTLTATTNSSGTTSNNWLLVGDGDAGIVNVTAGTLTNTGDVSIGAGALGTVNVSGGTMTVAVGKALYIGAGWDGSSNGTGVLTVSGSGTVSATDPFAIRLGPNGTATGTGTINLDGGTFSTAQPIVKGTSANATAIFNFNGGTLQAQWHNTTLSGLTSANVKDGGAVIDSQAFNLTINQALLAASANGGLTKLGVGTLILGGVNTYTGDTLVNAGTLTLADNAGFKFVIGASGVNNGVSGTGIMNLDGDFTFDLTGADAVGSWTIVDVGALTETFGATFTVAGFTDNLDNTWTSGNYTFSETSGLLTAVPEPSTLAMLAGGIGMLIGLQRRRRA